jgi:5,10-methenyltetrahydrofolate synthetase
VKTLNNLRQNLLEIRLRSNRDDAQRKCLENKVASFFEQLNDCCVAIYWPINSEFDLRPLALNWARYHPNRVIALPIVQLNEPLKFGIWTENTTMQKGPQGINEPLTDPDSVDVQPDIIIAPCLGWSDQNKQFWRIGYGGGYYDRTLALYKKKQHNFQSVGVAYNSQKVSADDWCPQEHDQALDLIISA